MSSRRHREHTSSSRKDDYRLYTTDIEAERTRQTMSTSQRHNMDPNLVSSSHDKHHRSRRTDLAGGDMFASSAPYTSHKPSSRDHVYAVMSNPSYYNPGDYVSPPDAVPLQLSSRARDADPYDQRTISKARKADKRSPPSADEIALAADQGKSSRTRSNHAPSAPPPQQPPSSSHAYFIPPEQQAESSSRRREKDSERHRIKDREKDRDRDAERERRREKDRKERERAERKAREREAERREQEAIELRRREEKERAREVRRQEKEKERRRLEKEAQRSREHRSRRHKESRDADHSVAQDARAAAVASSMKYREQRADDRSTARQLYPDQLPSSSSNVALPATQFSTTAQATSSARNPTTDDARSGDQSAYHREHGAVPDRDRRSHRSRRDKSAAPQYPQESGVSSSEQEHSGRERATRTTSRRHPSRDYYADAQPSGPSESENDRASGRDRRKHSLPHDGYGAAYTTGAAGVSSNSRVAEQRHHTSAAPVGYTAVPQNGQSSAHVGFSAFQPHVPQVVSIRAGQGPSDPQPVQQTYKAQPSGTMTQASVDQTRSSDANGYTQPSRSNSVPQGAYLHPSAALSIPAQTVQSSHPQYAHFSAQQSRRADSSGQNSTIPPYNNMSSVPADVPIRPPSTAPTLARQNLAVPSYNGPIATQPDSRQGRPSGNNQQNLHATKVGPGLSLAGKPAEMHFQTDTTHSSAKLSVYQSQAAPVHTEIVVPGYNLASSGPKPPEKLDHYPSKMSPPDVPSKFPIKEESPRMRKDPADEKRSAPSPSVHPPKADYDDPFPGAYPPTNYLSSTTQPHSSSHHVPQPGEDTPRAAPLPIPEPRRLFSSTPAPEPSTPGTSYDPRSPKQHVPAPAPILSSSPFHSSRPQVSPGQSKFAVPPSPQVASHSVAPADQDQAASRSGHPSGTQTGGTPPYNSNSNPLRSPPVSNTPKHSPSNRLHPRRGSNDTITQSIAPTKPSPSSIQHRSLNQPPNVANGPNASSHAQSRHDTTNPPIVRPPTAASGYPESSRYRSAAPSSAYPQATTNPSMQHQLSNVLSPPASQSAANALPTVSHQTYDTHPSPQKYAPSVAGGTVGQASAQDASTRYYQGHPGALPQGYDHASAAPPRSAPTPQPTSASATQTSASAIAAAYRARHELGSSQEPASAPPTATSHRIPPRAAPSPAPTLTSRHYSTLPNGSGARTGYATTNGVPAPALTPVRGQTYPITAPAPAKDAPTPIPSHAHHSRTVSDPQYGQNTRVAISGHPSTPAPSKARHLANLQIPSPAPEPEQLRTPSSLAPSMLRGNSYQSANPAPSVEPSKEKDKEKDSRKKGIFGIFRSRSSPPKHVEVRPPAVPKASSGRPRASSQSTMNAVAASVKNLVAPHPNMPPTTRGHTSVPHPPKATTPAPTVPVPHSAPPTQTTYPHIQQQPPQQPQIIAPQPVQATSAIPPAGDKSSNGKMFTPFRLLSKRHRTVSAASVEAQDGTAPNTVIGGESVRSSTAGRPSPPLRDPIVATVDWRDREEAEQSQRKKYRRHRPGVTFDIDPDVFEEPSRRQRGRSSRDGHDTYLPVDDNSF